MEENNKTAATQPQPAGAGLSPNGTMQSQGAMGEDPGKTFGILSLVLPFIGLALPGLVLGILGRSKSKAAGFNNTLALAGIIISVIGMIIGIAFIALTIFGVSEVLEKCEELGPGTHTEGGVTYTCGDLGS